MALDRLATYLLQQRLLTRRQLEEAERTREFFGGELGSHCLKLGFLDEPALARALEAVTGFRYAGRDELLRAAPEALERLPPELARRHRVCPFGYEARSLKVAMLHPRDTAALADIERATGCRVEPWVTSEYRLEQALERHYKIRIGRPRAINLAPSPQRTIASPPPAPAGAPEVEIGLDGRPLDAEPDWDDPASHTIAAAGPAWSADAPADLTDRSEHGPDLLARLAERLARASSRDDVVQALLDFSVVQAPRAALLGLGREGLRVVGTRGRGLEPWRRPGAGPRLDAGGPFREVAQSSAPLRARLRPAPEVRGIFGGLADLPQEIALFPIQIRNRVAALLYLDGGEQTLPPLDSALFGRACAKAGMAFEILLLRHKLCGP